MAPLLRHLALLVHDVARARRFYEQYFAFNAGSEWMGETLFIRNDEGFDLALMRGEHPPNPGAFHHFGFHLPTADQVRHLRNRMLVDGIPILEEVEEPNLVSYKCVDSDGYTVEIYWSPT